MQVPYFNAPIFLQNKTQIGRIEEIFGGITNTVSFLRNLALLPLGKAAQRTVILGACHACSMNKLCDATCC